MLHLAPDVRQERLRVIKDAAADCDLEFWSGTMPSNILHEPEGMMLAETALPPDPLMFDDEGALVMKQAWAAVCAVNGIIAFFRLTHDSMCLMQGAVSTINDKTNIVAPMLVDRIDVRKGYIIRVVEFTLIEGNRTP